MIVRQSRMNRLLGNVHPIRRRRITESRLLPYVHGQVPGRFRDVRPRVVRDRVPLQARRIVQAVMFKEGGRSTFTTAGIQSLCVDATASPFLKGEVNVSLGCDGSARNANLEDEAVVVGIPFAMMEGICTVLKTHYQGWDKFMRG